MSVVIPSCGRLRSLLVISACLFAAATVQAQRVPRIGYVYPAGGRLNTSFEVVVGGQGLDNPIGVVMSGRGIQAEIMEHIKPLSAQMAGDIHEKLREMQTKMKELRKDGKLPPTEILPTIRKLLQDAELTEGDLRRLKEYDRKRNDPKQQLNAQIAETVRVKVTIDERAEPGLHQWRLRTAGGLSNPMRFQVGQHPEIREAEPPLEFDFEKYNGYSLAAKKAAKQVEITPTFTLPATINGRILPGQVDKFTFHATKGQQVVLAVQARSLIPYLADAVPGWFQAVVSLHDSSGHELAFADGYRFDPDPVVFYKIPDDGDYRVEVHDSIYRGREDFVYRITAGELPFLTGISPLGAPAGSKLDITYAGGNLGGQNKVHLSGARSCGHCFAPGQSRTVAFQSHSLPDRHPRRRSRTGAQQQPRWCPGGQTSGDHQWCHRRSR